MISSQYLEIAGTQLGSQPRAGAAVAYHVLNVMESLLASASSGRTVDVASSCERPAPVTLRELA